jgi:hypothetical protein
MSTPYCEVNRLPAKEQRLTELRRKTQILGQVRR